MTYTRLSRGMTIWVAFLIGCGQLESPTDDDRAIEVAAIDLATPWERHIIVAGATALRGADGVHMADINDDGRLDLTTGHEQGNKVTVSLHPLDPRAPAEWPKVVLPDRGTISAPEDAIFADVDGDAHKDVIVGSEGNGGRVTVLFSPDSFEEVDLLTATNWSRMDLLVGMRAMRIVFADVAGDSRPEIVVGGKESGTTVGASIGYYRLMNPSAPRAAASWMYTPIRSVGWVMQVFVVDAEGDGDRDIVYTDKDRIDVPALDLSARGLRWLENGGGATPTWTEHQISLLEADHKWFDIVQWDADDDIDIVDCRSNDTTHQNNLWLNNGDWQTWTRVVIPEPTGVGQCQHITFANIDNAGPLDLGISYSHAGEPRSGVAWLHNAGTASAPVWERGEIGGNANGDGIKFDNLFWHDIDGDGDLDAVTSEQHEPDPAAPIGIGTVWYQNPLNP